MNSYGSCDSYMHGGFLMVGSMDQVICTKYNVIFLYYLQNWLTSGNKLKKKSEHQ